MTSRRCNFCDTKEDEVDLLFEAENRSATICSDCIMALAEGLAEAAEEDSEPQMLH